MIKVRKAMQMVFGLLLLGLQPAWAVAPATLLPPVVQLENIGNFTDFSVAPDGSVWLLSGYVVQHLTANGNLIKQFDWYDTPVPSAPLYVSKIALAPDGSVWVVNALPIKIQHYTADGVLIAEFGSIGTGVGQINEIFNLDIQIAADGSVWLVDIQNNRVQHYQPNGTFISQFGSNGTGAGQFSLPTKIALAKDGSVWVSDGSILTPLGIAPANYRLQHFKADGTFIEQFGNQKSQDPSDISDIAVAADGSVWVADLNSFQHFKTDGTAIESINSTGLGSNTAAATQVKVAADGSLWTGADNRFIQHRSADGNILAEFMGKTRCTAEYDDIRQTLYLWGVAVGQPYYDAVLQFQNGRYEMVSSAYSTYDAASGTSCNQVFEAPVINTATFNLSNNILSIASVLVANKSYQASFNYLGNNVFSLQSATPLGN